MSVNWSPGSESAGGSSAVTAWGMPAAPSLGWSFTTLSAAHRDEHSVVQPQEHVTTQAAIVLLDHLVRSLQERRRDRQAKALAVISS